MPYRRNRNRDVPDPFENYDPNHAGDYVLGRERRPDGTYEYFSGHVDRPAAGDARPVPSFEEAGRQGFQRGAREAHNAGLFRG